MEQTKKQQPNNNFHNWELAAKVIIDCKTTAVHKFRTSLAFTQYDSILQHFTIFYNISQYFVSADKNQKFIWGIKHANKIIVLGYKIDLLFNDYKFAI